MRAAAKLRTAIGQIFRHTCGATSRVNGTRGTMPCQNRSSHLTPRHRASVARLAATPTTANMANQRDRARNRFTASSASIILLCLIVTRKPVSMKRPVVVDSTNKRLERVVQGNDQTLRVQSLMLL